MWGPESQLLVGLYVIARRKPYNSPYALKPLCPRSK